MSSRDRATLERIHCLLNGADWSPDTLDAIARVLVNDGWTVLEPDEYEDRVRHLETMDLTRSDAQAVVDVDCQRKVRT